MQKTPFSGEPWGAVARQGNHAEAPHHSNRGSVERTQFGQRSRRWTLAGTLVLFGAACERGGAEDETEPRRPALELVARTSAPPHAPGPTPVETQKEAETSAEPPSASLCPGGTVRVKGDYCPSVAQTCLEYHPEYVKRPHDPTVSDRCLRYASPSRCLAARRELDFCMDRFEYPNREGALPRVLTSWLEAEKICESDGKRLCTEDEFNFACEGPEMLPYATGYERNSTLCNFDRDYRRPDHTRRMKPYDECPGDPFCKSELERLDQRHAIGARLSCTSWSGVIDLNGNVNEWVRIPGAKPPSRSGLKGGWWGPVRDRCRPTVRFHKENDYGYEAGFRCCADVSSGGAPTTERLTR